MVYLHRHESSISSRTKMASPPSLRRVLGHNPSLAIVWQCMQLCIVIEIASNIEFACDRSSLGRVSQELVTLLGLLGLSRARCRVLLLPEQSCKSWTFSSTSERYNLHNAEN